MLYVFLVLAHERRRILHFGVTAHPTAEWTAQQLREAFPWDSAPRYLLRDRDRIFGCEFTKQVKELGIEEVLGAPRAPRQRAYIERVIGAVRRECLDHVIVFSEAGLSEHLRKFTDYYHGSRTHLSLQKDTPESRPYPSTRSRADRGDSGGRWAPSSVRTSRRLNRIELSHRDQLLSCRWIDRRAALCDRGPRRSRRRRQQSLPHGTQITPSTVYLSVCVC